VIPAFWLSSLHDAPRRDSYDAERRTTKGLPKKLNLVTNLPIWPLVFRFLIVEKVIQGGTSEFLPELERIAVFDSDGADR